MEEREDSTIKATSLVDGASSPAERDVTTDAVPCPDDIASIPSKPASSKDVDLPTQIFRFLSTATPSTLGGIAACLAAVTYFILGQLGLLLIGAFAGATFFIHWQASNPQVAKVVTGERGIDVVARLLGNDRLAQSQTGEEDAAKEEDQYKARSFSDFQPETKEALNNFVDAVIRDYVNWWYAPIVPSDRSFAFSCRRALTSFILAISNHLSKKRPADAFLDFLTNSSSIVIVFFSELSAAFAEVPAESSMSAADAVYGYLAANPNSSLSNLLSQKQQAAKFKMVAEDLLIFLDRPMFDCDPMRVFLREIISGVILEMTLQTASSADWINGWIVYLLEAGEPELSQAIDVGMATGPDAAVFADIDGNVGNMGLAKGNRSSSDLDKSRRKENLGHRKQLSKAEEETENALEEMKRMNEMLAGEAKRASLEQSEAKPVDSDASKRLASALERNANDLDIQATTAAAATLPLTPRQPDLSKMHMPTSSFADGSLAAKGSLYSPTTPTTLASASQQSSPDQGRVSPFTNFDQFVPPAKDVEEESLMLARTLSSAMSLHNATVTIYDDDVRDNSKIRTKPAWDYLMQIEPATTQQPGWMIARQYGDFEKLHEVLRRIAAISGAAAFTEQHKELPQWRMHTRASLRGELERYVKDACWYQPLADSEGMKRFLDKDQATSRQEAKSGFQAFESMGKNMLGVLANAPKGVAEGGKVFAGGVTGVFNNIGIGPRKSTSSSLQDPSVVAAKRLSMPSPQRVDSVVPLSGSRTGRDSIDSQRSSVVSTQPGKMPPMERRPSYQSTRGEAEPESSRPSRSDRWERPISAMSSRASSMAALRSPLRSPSAMSLDALRLPPPPDAIADDYGSPMSPGAQVRPDLPPRHASSNSLAITSTPNGNKKIPEPRPTRQWSKLSEGETQVAVELVFAIINELYTLSSAWNIRRTLLAAAKSFLLRPGNPSLASIQTMIQTSVIDTNTSDAGIALHLRKLCENTMPTEAERATWPEELKVDEKEKLRIKARQLLIQSGVPAALMGVMGQNATSDALGRVFDCLQIEEVARGLIFGIMLQAVRVITH